MRFVVVLSLSFVAILQITEALRKFCRNKMVSVQGRNKAGVRVGVGEEVD